MAAQVSTPPTHSARSPRDEESRSITMNEQSFTNSLYLIHLNKATETRYSYINEEYFVRRRVYQSLSKAASPEAVTVIRVGSKHEVRGVSQHGHRAEVLTLTVRNYLSRNYSQNHRTIHCLAVCDLTWSATALLLNSMTAPSSMLSTASE